MGRQKSKANVVVLVVAALILPSPLVGSYFAGTSPRQELSLAMLKAEASEHVVNIDGP